MDGFQDWLLRETTKVVDSAGSPLVVWHGSHQQFNRFDPGTMGTNDDGYYGRGFYFSPDRETAEEYGPARPFHLNISNPFTIPSHPTSDHESLFDLRDKLAALKGVHVRPVSRDLPPGYVVNRKEVDNSHFNNRRPESSNNRRTFMVYSVVPKPELYGTDREIYGRDAHSALHAIVQFNDQVVGDSMRSGWASQLLKELIDRNKLMDVLVRNGYDGIFVVNPESGKTNEYVAFDPDQIVSVSS